MKISVAIPAFTSNEYKGDMFLKELIESILEQTYDNYEIVISDQSSGDEIFEIVKEYVKKVDIKYFRNKKNIGNISANTNNAIRKSNGEIIKVLHIDDIICNKNLFKTIVEKFKSNPNMEWGACGFNHHYVDECKIRREMIPDSGGVIGNPSVSFFINHGKNNVFYDECLKYILDSDYNSRLIKAYGNPIIIPEMSITVRMHKAQASKKLNKFMASDVNKQKIRDNNKGVVKVDLEEKQKHIVVGGAGFIGSNLVDKLIEIGKDVLVIDNLLTGKAKYLNPKAGFFKLDISDKSCIKPLENIINENDIIYHLAALPRVQPSIINPIEFNQTNVNGTLHVLFAASNSKAKRVIYSTSSSVYGNSEEYPITEKCSTSPLSPYALQKLVGEEYCQLFSKIYNLDTVCLRYFNVYGERMANEGAYCTVMGIFGKQLMNKQKLTITNDGKQLRDFTYVQDVVNANILAGEHENDLGGEVFNIGSGINFSINEIADIMSSNEKEYIGHVLEPFKTLADNSKAKKILKWEPKGDLKSWVKKYKNEIIK